MWRAYEAALARRPALLKSVTNGALTLLADAGTQSTEPAGVYDIQRGFALTSLATAWGLYIHHYLNFLDRRWPQGGGISTLAPKVLFNQFLHNPLVYLPLFFTYTGLVRGKTLAEVRDHARRDGWNMLCATWAVFVPVNLVSFAFVPLRHQAVLNAGASFVYAIVQSVFASRATKDGPGLRRRPSLMRVPSKEL